MQRDTSVIANRAERLLQPSLPSLRPWRVSSFVDVEDGRSWHPDPERGAVTVGGRWARLVVHPRPAVAYSRPLWSWRGTPRGVQVPVGLRFESPLKVITCLRRKVRREVIFARRKAGAGARSRVRARNWRSEIGC